jgi:hypothetical protein
MSQRQTNTATTSPRRSLPAQVGHLCAGFPCQDLSQAGRTAGLDGARYGLIGEVFRLLSRRRIAKVAVESGPLIDTSLRDRSEAFVASTRTLDGQRAPAG